MNLSPSVKESIASLSPYAKERRAAYLRLAARIQANPDRYSAEDIADAQQVLLPTLPEKDVA